MQVRKESGVDAGVPENVYRGDLVAFPGPWGLGMGRSSIILVSDQELEMLSDPDKALNISLTMEKREESLRQVCERAKAQGHRTLVIAFDHFFAQYRPGQAGPRRLTPDMGEYIKLIAEIGRFAEARMGQRLEACAHATWAESPTIDWWETGQENHYRSSYEYNSNFVWSNTVHQAASARHDYFKWGDFLTGNGNDHGECGWLDRNYVGLALACSTGILNETPHSYAGHWGMPAEIARRRSSLTVAYGTAGMAHRHRPTPRVVRLSLLNPGCG